MFQGNWVDLLVLIGVLVFAIDGVRNGLISGLLEFLGFVLSLLSALLFYSKTQIVFTKFFTIPQTFAAAAGFLLTWFIVETAYFLIVRVLYRKLPKILIGHPVNRFGGAIPAVANGLLFWAFLLTFATAIPLLPSNFKSDIFGSKIGGFVVLRTNQIEKPLASVFGPAVSEVQKSLTFLTVVPASRQSVNLNFTQKELRVDAVSEQKMLELVNSERTKIGIRALTFDPALRDVARAHSRDMFQRGYFAHYSPEGADALDRLMNAEVQFTIAGENLAYAPDVLRAHDGLMNSPGHRKNILTPEFGKVGIGVIDGGIYSKMFTQVFTD